MLEFRGDRASDFWHATHHFDGKGSLSFNARERGEVWWIFRSDHRIKILKVEIELR